MSDRSGLEVARLSAAFALAAIVHADQVRKCSTTPYMAHLLGVTELVWVHGGTDTEAAAALLHDAVEDGGGDKRITDITRACGADVAAIVSACSDSFVDTTGGANKLDWLTRKRKYIDHLESTNLQPGALLVSACDKLHNLTATRKDYEVEGEPVWSRFKTGWRGQVWYYRSLLPVYTACDDPRVTVVASQIQAELGDLENALRQRGHDTGCLGPPYDAR
jgi:GTP pyrophosphokinase